MHFTLDSFDLRLSVLATLFKKCHLFTFEDVNSKTLTLGWRYLVSIHLLLWKLVTFSILSLGQVEGLHLHRNQLDLQLRRHQKQILRLAHEASTVSSFEQLFMGQHTFVSLVCWEEDEAQEWLHFQCMQGIWITHQLFAASFPLALTGTIFADRHGRQMSIHLDDVENILLLGTNTTKLELIHKQQNITACLNVNVDKADLNWVKLTMMWRKVATAGIKMTWRVHPAVNECCTFLNLNCRLAPLSGSVRERRASSLPQ